MLRNVVFYGALSEVLFGSLLKCGLGNRSLGNRSNVLLNGVANTCMQHNREIRNSLTYLFQALL